MLFDITVFAGYVKEHRLVIAQAIGRCLIKGEVVHHKDRNRHNNTLENLELTDNKKHYPIKHLMDRIRELEEEVSRLKIVEPDKDMMTLVKTRKTLAL